nr:hypothetical protein [Actinospica acidithermotolerans]
MRRSSDPSASRRPIAAATSATESIAISSSTSEERNAIRSVRIVARRWASAARRICRSCPLVRPNAASVGSPATTSRKWPPRRWSAVNLRSISARVRRPMSTMNTGISGTVTAMMTADSGSAARIRIPISAGTTAASVNCGR